MAKYTINHTCGHQVTIQLYGPYANREKRIAYLETCECEECRIAKANAASAAAIEQRGLSNLTGTEKQIAWANTIREKAYKCLDTLTPFCTNDEARQMVAGWKAKLDVETSAAWWIDHRYELPTEHGSHPVVARQIIATFNQLFNR